MITIFREIGSKKVLKELNLDFMVMPNSQVLIGEHKYGIMVTQLNTDNITCTAWIKKLK